MLQTVPVRDVRTGLRYKTGANVPQSIRFAQGEGRHAEQGGKPAEGRQNDQGLHQASTVPDDRVTRYARQGGGSWRERRFEKSCQGYYFV